MSSAIDTPPAAVPKPNSFQRLAGVIMSPGETFESIARQPDWVVPLVLWMLLSLAGGIIMAQKVDFGAAAREAIEQRKDMPPDAAERAVKLSAAIGKVSAYCAPIFAGIVFAIVAALLLVAFRLFGGEGTFRQAFSATLYAWVPNIIQNVVFLIVLLAKGGHVDITAMQTVVRSNPAFLVDPKTNAIAFALLGSLDAFRIWTLILFVIGFAAVGRTSKAKSASIVIPLWLVAVLFSLIPAAMKSMR